MQWKYSEFQFLKARFTCLTDTRYLFRIGFLANTWNQVSLRGVDPAFVCHGDAWESRSESLLSRLNNNVLINLHIRNCWCRVSILVFCYAGYTFYCFSCVISGKKPVDFSWSEIDSQSSDRFVTIFNCCWTSYFYKNVLKLLRINEIFSSADLGCKRIWIWPLKPW